ncbi:uncharacterized protein LY89DRAFT_596406 [Mollisia scopiformis]|uniref:Zn(2)-C6 fungal-type domain-containing protein n=1 Tax=Mollisia scopiformis TaxID=149040 RepID=A0A132BES2_MOLSC|nr:uncharacterized protein LY89DRAFT_596406 [Mollisia scopiformis]KUJ10509.1 hypothetical protein LY89DRAFT_596406 [Mollisia scopiformis]
MSFRKIRPSFGESSASTSSPSQATPESSSTGSDPRRARGEKEIAENSNSASKRRRVPESVTRNACLNCKKARAKCDGKKPCKRCATRLETSDCIYEIHIKHAKEELVKQIKELKAKDHLSEQILQALSTDEKVSDILERLKKGETYESIVEWLGRSPVDDLETLSPRESQHSTFDASDHEMGGVPGTTTWTTVTANQAVMDHLLQLYFAWVHPVHTLFDEGHFVDCYKRQLDDYCSSVLVNSICAMACHLHPMVEGEEIDFEQLGMEFIDAVRIEIDPIGKRITMIQAFAVMFLVDCARANGLRASSYLKVATTNLRGVIHQDTDGFADVWKNTVRGVRNLNIEWSQITFQPPSVLSSAIHDAFEESDDVLDDASWYFYRSIHDEVPSWPGLLATTNREKAKLTAIIQDVITIMYTPAGPLISARDILHQYRRLVAWREDLSGDISNLESHAGHALPHVLSLLILYNSSVVQLFRPLLVLESFHSPMVEETIWNHAQQGLFLLDEQYRTKFSCRYQPVMQMFAVLHLSDTIARFFPGGVEGRSKDGPEAIQFGLEVLMQSAAGFPVANPLQEMLRREAKKCSIRLPRTLDLIAPKTAPQQVYRIDDFIDACTRPTFTQPFDELIPRYMASFSADWAIQGASGGFLEASSGRSLRVQSAEERGAQHLMQIRNLLNTS